MANIIIFQQNLHRSLAPTQELIQNAGLEPDSGNIKLLCIQEPYTVENAVRGLGSGFNIHAHSKLDQRIRAAIATTHTNLLTFLQFCTPDCVVVCVNWRNTQTLYNIYIDPFCEFENALRHLELVWKDLGNSPLLIIGDINAKHRIWGSTVTDNRGKMFYDFCCAHRLQILNDGIKPTYHQANSESFVDLSICTAKLLPFISEWQEEIKSFAVDVTRRIIAICEVHLPKLSQNKYCQKKVKNHWWSPQLTALRNRLLAAQKISMRSTQIDISNIIQFNKTAIYMIAIKSAKINSWKNYCSSQSLNPWGKIYKFIKKPENLNSTPTKIETDTGFTTTPLDTANALADAFFPKDTNDDISQATIREDSCHAPNTPNDKVFCLEEVDRIIYRQNDNKGPGNDALSADTIKHVGYTKPTHNYCQTYSTNACNILCSQAAGKSPRSKLSLSKVDRRTTQPKACALSVWYLLWLAGYIAKNKKDILFPNIPSAIRPVPHGPDIPVPLPPESDTLRSASSSTETESPVDHTYEPGNTGDDRCYNQNTHSIFGRANVNGRKAAAKMQDHIITKRATCDLFSFLGMNHTLCAAHCIMKRRGFRGGYCTKKATASKSDGIRVNSNAPPSPCHVLHPP
ncbi:hypothetical protein ANN_05027 [Periplaneta americana]|uniref:Invertebrate defensins family profile domain-containing protein n=1 Tax=Periplaneta americana TaxID=6978 RepID=A0ABQ8TBN1_PERAM|nr:hypothetical protein ANN_05027 [Periplaneta americana]